MKTLPSKKPITTGKMLPKPDELNLFTASVPAQSICELTSVESVVENDLPAPLVAIEVQYELVKRQQSPPPVVGDDYAAIAGIERRGVSSFVLHARTEALQDTERGVAIVHRESTHIAEVELRPLGRHVPTLDPITSGELAEVRSAATRMSAVVEDVLDVLVSNAIENLPDAEGYYTLEIDSILDTRGLTKKQKGGLGARSYAAGHHLEARLAVVDGIRKLDSLYVALEPAQNGKKKRFRNWDRLLSVQRYTLEEPTDRVYAIRYELGTWFKRWKDEHVLAHRRILELDAKREASAKTLARYFTQRRLEADQAGRIIRRVRDLFTDTGTELNRGKNPQRARNWLENALNTLQSERIIARWSYVQPLDSLPRYKWIGPWLELHVAITLK